MRAPAPTPLAGKWRPEPVLAVSAWVIFAAFAYGPVIGLMGQALGHLVSGDEAAWALLLPSARRAGLFAKSIGSAAAVTLVAGLLGTLAALGFLRMAAGRSLPPVLIGALLAAMVVWAIAPAYLHALAGMELGYWLTGIGLGAVMPEWPGWLAVIFVQSFALLPFAAGAALVGFIGVERDLIEAGALHRGGAPVFFRIALPLAAPALAAGLGAVFVFALLDASTPSLFGVSSYAMEISAEYGATHDAWRAALLALPLILAAGLALALVLVSLAQSRASHGRTWRKALAIYRPADPAPALSVIGFAIALGYVLLALVLLIGGGLGVGAKLPELLWTVRQDLAMTIANGFVAGALVLFPAGVVGWTLAARNRLPLPRWLLWGLVLMPLALPPALTGAGIAALLTGAPDGLRTFALVPGFAHVARFLPLAILVVAAQIRRLDPLLIDAARLQHPPGIRRWRQIEIPLIMPGLAAAFGLTFCASIGELEATLMSAPPGAALLSMRVFNYLHYGVSETVAALGLMLVVLVWLGAVAGLALAGGRKRERRGDG